MCCTEVVKSLDQIALSEDENAKLALSGVLKLVTTCFSSDQTVTEGLKTKAKEQRIKEEATGRSLHAQALLNMLDKREDTINRRFEGLGIARKLLDNEIFKDQFHNIQELCR